MGRYRPPEDLDLSLDAGRATKKPRIVAPVQHTVRFEMPFAIWCTTCPSGSTSALIGQGVRFNATKMRVGNYFSTPIWAFRMRHPACGCTLELRTDPKNSDFTVTEGARKRDYGDDETVAKRSDTAMLGRLGPSSRRDKEEEEKRQDAFAMFEGKAADKEQARSQANLIEELQMESDRFFHDADGSNRKLRDQFRKGQRERQADEKRKEQIAERMGLGFDLADANADDAAKAAAVDFGEASEIGSATPKVDRRPFLNTFKQPQTAPQHAKDRRKAFQHEILTNTRASMDPFDSTKKTKKLGRANLGLRKREARSNSVSKDKAPEL